MRLNRHYDLQGKHAFLSASKYHWVSYDEDHLDFAYDSHNAARRGTELHELAFNLIRLGVNLPRTSKTLNNYVNDALGYRMTPEQPLFYSNNAFCTADALGFKNNLLRVFDLKTGKGPTSEKQLWVAAAFFCLEYGFRATELKYDLRIYQNDEVRHYEADPVTIALVMDRTVTFSDRIDQRKEA